jgi:hypothetical protein
MAKKTKRAKRARIPFMKILTIGAVSTASIFASRNLGLWRKARIAKGETDPMPWAVDIPGGTATVAAAAMAAGSAFFLRGRNQQLGYLAAGVSLYPAGKKLLGDTWEKGLIASDHAAPSDRRLAAAQDRYAVASSRLASASFVDAADA